MKIHILIALLFVACSCNKQESNPVESVTNRKTPNDTISIQKDTIVLLQLESNIGNRQYGIADSIFLRFNKSVTVNYIHTNNISINNYTYADSNHTISFSYPNASLGISYSFECSVYDKTGATFIQTLNVNFYNKKIQISGCIFNIFFDDKEELYWVATKNPNKILCFSFPNFTCIKEFDIPYGSSKFSLNPYNSFIYVLCNDRSTSSNDSMVYVFDSQNGKLSKKIGFTRDGYDHPQYPRIYPYDIGFTSTGYGIALLRDEFFSGLRWKVIDSKNNDSIYIHSAWGYNTDQYQYFHKIYPNYDKSKLLLMEEYGFCAIDVLDGNTHTFQHRVPSSVTRGVFLTPNRKDNRIYCGQLYDQFILDINGNLSQISYIDNRSNGTADFSYRTGEQNFIYFIDDDYFRVIDYGNAIVPMWCNVIYGLRDAITTLDGLYLLTYRTVGSYSEIILFNTDDFYKYNINQTSKKVFKKVNDQYLFNK